MMKTKKEQLEYDFKIDYELFTTQEIVKIFNFYSLLLKHSEHPLKQTTLQEAYQEYRKILNNISLEKKYDKMFEKQTGISIYKTMKTLKD